MSKVKKCKNTQVGDRKKYNTYDNPENEGNGET